MLPPGWLGLNTIWPEFTGDGWKVCMTLPLGDTGEGWKVCMTLLLGDTSMGTDPVDEAAEASFRFLVFFLLVGDSLEEEPGEDDLEDEPLLPLELLAGLV